MENAFRKAMGQEPNNRITSKTEEKLRDEKVAKEIEEENNFGRFGLGEEEITNKHGYKELGFYDNGRWFPICAQCGAHTMPNHGQGMCCDSCHHDAFMHTTHDDF